MDHSDLSAVIAGVATGWFDALSDRADADEVVAFLDLDDLEMAFPETTLRDEAQFRSWYDTVGTLFRDQAHEIEFLGVTRTERGAHVDVVVVWSGRDAVSGEPFRFRVRQNWDLVRRDENDFLISRYEVGPMQRVDALAGSA